jgi:hypothetical protein
MPFVIIHSKELVAERDELRKGTSAKADAEQLVLAQRKIAELEETGIDLCLLPNTRSL